jgi:ribonuclease P protein component
MLKKQHRLPAGQKLTNAKIFSTEYFRILIRSNNTEYNRFGFVVGKKIDTRAVVRNRLKRVLREVVTNFLQSPVGHDVLFVVKKSFEEEPTQRIQEAVNGILQKAFL